MMTTSTTLTTDETLIEPNGANWRTTGCPVCLSRAIDDFFTLRGVPAQDGVLWETAEAARQAPRGDIQLMLCRDCGYIGNRFHDPSKVQFVGYDVSLQHSPLFRLFTHTLAAQLMERYDLRNKTIIDIGCGKGYFLSTLCAMGMNHGIGFDPSYTHDASEAEELTTFIKDYYSPAYAHYAADMISCRHVIDILPDPVAFLSMVRKNIGAHRPVVYFESPDASYTFTNNILWNIVYEHKSWFTLSSYRALFERCGFDVLNVSRCWNNEYLGIEAVPMPLHSSRARLGRDATSIKETETLCASFAAGYSQTVKMWGERLDRLAAEQKNVALWGSGARGISFLNFFAANDFIQTVIDINPARQGKYLPISAQCVQAPERLPALDPDVIIISNPTYEREIREQAAQLGYGKEFIVL